MSHKLLGIQYESYCMTHAYHFVNFDDFSDDWHVECNENKTPNVNDETASRKKDVWNIYCQGEKISEFTYQKRKAAIKARFNIS